MKKDLVKLKSSAKPKKKSVLNKIIDFFINSKYRAYLVGGYIRDITLGTKPFDIDIVVEGDGISAARQLNRKLKGNLTLYPQFGTASIMLKNKRVDLASARLESYPTPGKLPHIYPSSIINDLNRRDFTINAIAMSISKENFGEIYDPFNGLQDIKKGLIRILHKKSFIDDPTRIFRALRYKNRFGFRIEPETEKLMKSAIAKNLINHLSGKRLLNELQLILAEETYRKTLRDISDYGIYKIKNHTLQAMRLMGRERLYFYLSRLKSDRFPLTKEEKKKVADFRRFSEIVSRLSRTSRASKIYQLLSPLNIDVVKVIPLIKPRLRTKVKKFLALRKKKAFISGNDLLKLGFKPGKRFKHLLESLFMEQLDKKLKTRKEAIAYLKKQKKR